MKRGSNERQFGCQNLNLPFITITRKSFGNYKEYHTSLDNLNFINEKNLQLSLKAINSIINEVQENRIFTKNTFCEYFLTKYKLIDTVGFVYKKNTKNTFKDISNLLAYADRNNDITELSKICKISKNKTDALIKKLVNLNLLKQL